MIFLFLWLNSLRMTLSGSIHVAENGLISFFLLSFYWLGNISLLIPKASHSTAFPSRAFGYSVVCLSCYPLPQVSVCIYLTCFWQMCLGGPPALGRFQVGGDKGMLVFFLFMLISGVLHLVYNICWHMQGWKPRVRTLFKIVHGRKPWCNPGHSIPSFSFIQILIS